MKHDWSIGNENWPKSAAETCFDIKKNTRKGYKTYVFFFNLKFGYANIQTSNCI